MVDALAAGTIDAALVWGPQAGWFAARSPVPLRVEAAAAPANLKAQHFDFAIAMGVRHGDEALRHALDDFIARRHADIDRILAEYSVPVVAEGTR
jgi:mxaJ protein